MENLSLDLDNYNLSLFNLEKLTKLRHWFHQNAELSYQEFKTQAKIREFLTKELTVSEE